MRKHISIFFVLCFTLINIVIAQQKIPLKKPVTKKTQIPKVNTGPKIRDQKVEIIESMPSNAAGAVPMIIESSEDAKFRRERICTDCDTLKLEPNKQHIVIYDVKWMANRETRSYREQPNENDLNKDYYALRGENKREWDELKKNFPQDNFIFHHVYRNTYIEISNKKNQILNLLDRQERHEGFLYWNGNENDSIIHHKNMTLLTEIVAKQTGDNKKSSYYDKFLKDSLSIQNYQKTVSPSGKLAENMNTFLLEEIIGETVLPLQFFEMSKVSQITIQSQSEVDEKLIFKLNTSGQLTHIIEGTRDSTIVSYKDHLPTLIKNRSKISKIFYQGDTVIIKDDDYLKINKLVDRVFFKTKTYLVNQDSYSKMTLDNGFESKLSTINNSMCILNTNENNGIANKSCYSNTSWQLPLKISYENRDNNSVFESETVYNKNENNIIIEDINKSKSTKIEYILENGKPTSITSSIKRGDDPYGEPYKLTVNYLYFK